MGYKISDKYRLGAVIGTGAFGESFFLLLGPATTFEKFQRFPY